MRPHGKPWLDPRARVPWVVLAVLAWSGCRADDEKPAREIAQPAATSKAAAPVAPVPGGFARLEPGHLRVGAPQSEACRGDEEPQTEARVDHALEVSVLEVGQREFETRMGFDPSFNAGCAECPVDSVTHDEAAAYCNALSRESSLELCYACTGEEEETRCRPMAEEPEACAGYRLPTELEWEFAARAGTRGPTHAGPITSCMSSDDVADRIGWYKADSGGRSHPRGQKLPNPWGLYDMAGNAYEWTQGVVNPESDASSEDDSTDGFRVLRGGSWYHNAHHMRAASRLRVPPGRRLSYAGFRCVRTLSDAE